MPQVSVTVDREEVGMGMSVTLTTRVTPPDGVPGAGYRVLPYCNGKRWGAHELTDADGVAVNHIPLPNPGIAELRAGVLGSINDMVERWIWTPDTKDQQTCYFCRDFSVAGSINRARLWVAVDNHATVYVNGIQVAQVFGWIQTAPLEVPVELLKTGPGNLLAVEAVNETGPAGLLLRLELASGEATAVVGTDSSWRVAVQRPENWPGGVEEVAGAVQDLGRPDGAHWSDGMGPWPNLANKRDLIAGVRPPAEACLSDPVTVRVAWRLLEPPPPDPDHLVGMQWEPWFTPHNANWRTAQAVPLMGFYWSWNPDVTRQHMLWMAESGVDFLVVDWTNHLWDREHWDERGSHTNEIMLATTLALDVLAGMRDEGMRVPKGVLYLGINNGPSTTMGAVNEEIAWIYHNYVRNPRFEGLFQDYLGKPLLLIHNGGGPQWLKDHNQPPPNDEHFTIRWQSFQHEFSDHADHGYWSWMDATLEPVPTYFENQPEALTISTAFFSQGGWKNEGAYGRLGGWTYIEEFKSALKYRPRFIQLHQFQEFAGQYEGGGYGPNKDIYVDSYSVELSDDIEPVSLTTPAYRGDGGWGFLYLNLTRALVDLYRQPVPETTVVAVREPVRGQTVSSDILDVSWNWIGKAPAGFEIAVNGKMVANGLQGTSVQLDLSAFDDGPMHLVLTALGAKSRYALSYTEASLPMDPLVPASAEIAFTLARKP